MKQLFRFHKGGLQESLNTTIEVKDFFDLTKIVRHELDDNYACVSISKDPIIDTRLPNDWNNAEYMVNVSTYNDGNTYPIGYTNVPSLDYSESVSTHHVDNNKETMIKELIEQYRNETSYMSANRQSHQAFNQLLSFGKDVVPLVQKELESNHTDLICLLEVLYPDNIPYKGYVSKHQARKMWLSVLNEIL